MNGFPSGGFVTSASQFQLRQKGESMELQQGKMQVLGLFGIYKEAYKLIFSRRKIFTQITLALIIPSSFIFLVQVAVSHYLFTNIIHYRNLLAETEIGSPIYNNIFNLLSAELVDFWLLKAAYHVASFIFSLLSTSAIVYTIACIYTGRGVTINKAISVVSKVWKRYAATFLMVFVTVLVYTVIAVIIVVLWAAVILGSSHSRSLFLLAVVVLYLVGLVYMSVVWELATTVSVLENVYGIQAMMKSKDLMRGNMGVALVIFLKLTCSYVVLEVAFRSLVVQGESLGMASRIAYGIACFVSLFMLSLFTLVLHTIIYFVCKSYHNEDIYRLDIWADDDDDDELEGYVAESVPLKGEDHLPNPFYV